MGEVAQHRAAPGGRDRPGSPVYAEALEILTKSARGGDVRAAIALAGRLRKRHGAGVDPVQAEIDDLARPAAKGAG